MVYVYIYRDVILVGRYEWTVFVASFMLVTWFFTLMNEMCCWGNKVYLCNQSLLSMVWFNLIRIICKLFFMVGCMYSFIYLVVDILIDRWYIFFILIPCMHRKNSIHKDKKSFVHIVGLFMFWVRTCLWYLFFFKEILAFSETCFLN